MRQFDSSASSEKGEGGRERGRERNGEKERGVEEARKSGSREYYRPSQSFAIAKLLVPSRCLLP